VEEKNIISKTYTHSCGPPVREAWQSRFLDKYIHEKNEIATPECYRVQARNDKNIDSSLLAMTMKRIEN
jgi:hypothetical protein